MLRLATQVQARTQQLTASEGQSGLLLVRTHGPNLAGTAAKRKAQYGIRYRSHGRNCPESELIYGATEFAAFCWAAAAAGAPSPPAFAQATSRSSGCRSARRRVGGQGRRMPDRSCSWRPTGPVPASDRAGRRRSHDRRVGKQVCIERAADARLRARRALRRRRAAVDLGSPGSQTAAAAHAPKGDICVRPDEPANIRSASRACCRRPTTRMRGAQILRCDAAPVEPRRSVFSLTRRFHAFSQHDHFAVTSALQSTHHDKQTATGAQIHRSHARGCRGDLVCPVCTVSATLEHDS